MKLNPSLLVTVGIARFTPPEKAVQEAAQPVTTRIARALEFVVIASEGGADAGTLTAQRTELAATRRGVCFAPR